ncbi:MFS transporter [Kitasatospora sp. YST-16]|uniref:MFS transporter n=1 Tax=Kitasatospora sp. YST-16 TaxID=2998080 RepID=UPI002284E767|nr:MFS transporter [Kitasatospora sp. YST-16]WAL72914.1 MFS transporter [Kitasatospora sp. YST-16]WNW38963.1 MFS transporter [Streptomyces sp. Li-HN-5-13]
MATDTGDPPRRLVRILHAATWREEMRSPVERRLAVALTTLYAATGLSYSALAVYMLRQEHLSPAVYGVGASVAGVLGLLVGPAIGALSDRVDGFVLYAVLMGVMAGATFCLTVAGPLAALGLLSVLVMCARGSSAVLGALIGRAVARDRRVRFRATVRAMSNVAMVVGLALGAAVLAVGTRTAFRASFTAEALALSVTGLLVWRARNGAVAAVPEAPAPAVPAAPAPAPADAAQPPGTLRDGRVTVLLLLNCLFCLAEPMLAIAVPLWVGARLRVPMWGVSVVLVVNTVVMVLLQVPAARRVTDTSQAARAVRAAALLFAVAALAFPLSAQLSRHLGAAAALCALVLFALVRAGGDVLYSVGSTSLSYELVPERSYGKSMGILGMGVDIAGLSAPALFGWFVNGGGALGWYVLAVLFVLGALPVRWIQNRIGERSWGNA